MSRAVVPDFSAHPFDVAHCRTERVWIDGKLAYVAA